MKSSRLLRVVVLMGVACAAPRALPISRVGNSVIADPQLEFQAQVPAEFVDIRRLSGGGLRLMRPGPDFFAVGAQGRPQLDLYPVAQEYPSIPDGDRDMVKDFFENLGASWTPLPTPESCVLALTATNGGTVTTVVVWGRRRGIVIISRPEADTRAARDELLRTLKLDRGVCEWR